MPQMPDPLDAILAASHEQQRQQQALQSALQAAATNPHTIERVNLAAIGVAEEQDGSRMLLVATPDGRRRDIRLSPDSIRVLARALSAEAAE